jgi:hypothetical protein
MDARSVLEFVDRDWTEIERSKRDHWTDRFRREGPAATLGASLALWQHARAVRPDWPTGEDRADDLAHHVTLKQLIDRASGALPRR